LGIGCAIFSVTAKISQHADLDLRYLLNQNSSEGRGFKKKVAFNGSEVVWSAVPNPTIILIVEEQTAKRKLNRRFR
jgi:hypothetical protein